jgi:predicted DNA-binding transcriptional regulator YafY
MDKTQTLTAYELKELLGKSPKQIERYMETLQNEFHNQNTSIDHIGTIRGSGQAYCLRPDT